MFRVNQGIGHLFLIGEIGHVPTDPCSNYPRSHYSQIPQIECSNVLCYNPKNCYCAHKSPSLKLPQKIVVCYGPKIVGYRVCQNKFKKNGIAAPNIVN